MDFEKARDWFCDLNSISNDIGIYWYHDDTIEGILENIGYLAFCRKMGYDYNKIAMYMAFGRNAGTHISPPRNVDLDMRPCILMNYESYRTLFHELVHHRQHTRGELSYYTYEGPFTECYWKGEKQDPDMPYKERPWEIEARAEEWKWLMKYETSGLLSYGRVNTSKGGSHSRAERPKVLSSAASVY